MGIQWSDGYSSKVEILLELKEQTLRVAQVGPDSLILREPRQLPARTDAVLVITVDGQEERCHVHVPQESSGALVRFWSNCPSGG